MTPFVLHSGNLNRALCIGLTSTSVSRSLRGIGMTRMKSDRLRTWREREEAGRGATDKDERASANGDTNVHVSIPIPSVAFVVAAAAAAVPDRFGGDIR